MMTGTGMAMARAIQRRNLTGLQPLTQEAPLPYKSEQCDLSLAANVRIWFIQPGHVLAVTKRHWEHIPPNGTGRPAPGNGLAGGACNRQSGQ
jgi:hypothetical protein